MFDWGNEDREARYKRESEELWRHAARLRAMRAAKANKAGKSAKAAKSAKGGSAEGEGEAS